jgi:hypothetical protein
MAERIVKWTLDGTILKLLRSIEEVVIGAEFDLAKIYPTFSEFNTIQQQIVVYGVKQKLADKGAGDIADYQGKVTSAKAKWDDLVNGKWAGERVNATGAAENKATLKLIKESRSTVSLTGLMMKKLTDAAHFTEEDQAKLDEFITLAAASLK